MNLLHWFTPVQFPAPAELKYDWFSLSHLKPAGDSFSALIARISLPLSFSVTSLWAQEIVGICTFFQASDDTNIFRLDGAEGLRRRHLECPGITSSLMMPLSASSESLMGNRVGNGMKTGNLGADKKKKKIGFSSVMLIPLGMGLVLTIPSHLRIFTRGIFKNQASDGKIQGIPTFN